MKSRRKPELRTEKHSVETIVDLLKLLEKLKLEGPDVAFRGQSRPWPLIPEIGRNPFLQQAINYDHWSAFEEDLLSKFKKYAYPFMSQRPVSDWDWLYIARHHGLPTRLLDWSSNPLKGLFFAVQDFRHDNQDSVLWALEVRAWMETLERQEFTTFDEMVLVYPAHINERIIAQDSCFTAFPLPKSHDEFVPADQQKLITRTVEIVIPAIARRNLRLELAALGLTHRSLLPGLEGVVRSIRQEFGEGWLHDGA